MRQIHRVIVTTLLLISYVTTNAQSYLPDIKSMTLEEKIGQLFMIDVYSNKPESYSYYANQVKKFNLGGVIFFQGTASQQVKLVKELQSVAKIPLLVGLDAEHGAGWRLKGSMTFPPNADIGCHFTRLYHLQNSINYRKALQDGRSTYQLRTRSRR